MTGDDAAPVPPRQVPQTAWLVATGITGLIIAAICSLTAHGVSSRGMSEFGDVERVAALVAWAQVTVTLGIVALVGATVLAGVAEIASRVSNGRAEDPIETSRPQ